MFTLVFTFMLKPTGLKSSQKIFSSLNTLLSGDGNRVFQSSVQALDEI